MTRDEYEIVFQNWLGTLDTKVPQSCLTELGQMCATYTWANDDSDSGHWDIVWGGWDRLLGIDPLGFNIEVVGEFNV